MGAWKYFFTQDWSYPSSAAASTLLDWLARVSRRLSRRLIYEADVPAFLALYLLSPRPP